METPQKKLIDRTAQFVLCAWIVGVQIWYFSKYAPAMESVLHMVLRNLWR